MAFEQIRCLKNSLDALNETPNTNFLEDLFVINQWKNEFENYGHYVRAAA